MTRINVVPVEELCDQHLLAEFRELTRIPNGILSGKLKPYYHDAPREYTLGKGHVKFFVNKLGWLWDRYGDLCSECEKRNFNVTWIWPFGFDPIGEYDPPPEALTLNRQRIAERMPKSPRWSTYK